MCTCPLRTTVDNAPFCSQLVRCTMRCVGGDEQRAAFCRHVYDVRAPGHFRDTRVLIAARRLITQAAGLQISRQLPVDEHAPLLTQLASRTVPALRTAITAYDSVERMLNAAVPVHATKTTPHEAPPPPPSTMYTCDSSIEYCPKMSITVLDVCRHRGHAYNEWAQHYIRLMDRIRIDGDETTNGETSDDDISSEDDEDDENHSMKGMGPHVPPLAHRCVCSVNNSCAAASTSAESNAVSRSQLRARLAARMQSYSARARHRLRAGIAQMRRGNDLANEALLHANEARVHRINSYAIARADEQMSEVEIALNTKVCL